MAQIKQKPSTLEHIGEKDKEIRRLARLLSIANRRLEYIRRNWSNVSAVKYALDASDSEVTGGLEATEF